MSDDGQRVEETNQVLSTNPTPENEAQTTGNVTQDDVNIHEPQNQETRPSRWRTLRHHLWDPVRLRQARVFASNTTRALSLSQSMSLTSPESEGHGDIVNNNQSLESSGDECCSSASVSVKKPEGGAVALVNDTDSELTRDMTNHPSKSECLKLIDKIWKGGLGHNLEQIRQRHQRVPQIVAMETEPSSCQKCAQIKEKLYSVSDDEQMLSSTEKNIVPPSSANKSKSFPENNIEIERDELMELSEPGETTGQDILSSENSENIEENQDQSQSGSRNIGAKCSQGVDGTSAVVPPFKKARFSWQVKNKSREDVLKQATLEAMPGKSSSTIADSRMISDSSGSVHSDTCGAKEMEGIVRTCVNRPDAMESDLEVVSSTSATTANSSITEARANSEQSPNPQDFHQLSEALTHLSYVERWQCQHVAKSIVDNAINKTLEEMGLSPNDNGTVYREQRTRIEDAGVSQAILSRGLRRYSPSSYRMRRLNPIINRLTRVSEDLFSENLRGVTTSDDQSDDNEAPDGSTGQLVTPDMVEMYINLDESLTSSDSDREDSSPCLVADPSTGLDGSATSSNWLTSEPDIATSATLQENVAERLREQAHLQIINGTNVSSTITNVNEVCSDVKDRSDSVQDCTSMQASSGDEEAETYTDCVYQESPSSKFVLDHAVDTVICERGLQFHELV